MCFWGVGLGTRQQGGDFEGIKLEEIMSEFKLSGLIHVEGEAGAYCDPVTGECVPAKSQGAEAPFAIDPVCQMKVDIQTAQYQTVYQEKTYYFCSAGCQHSFEAEPQKFIATGEQAD